MLYLIGVGLNDAKDVTLKGLEKAKDCDELFLEDYTSRLQCSTEELEGLYENEITLADRSKVEDSDEIIEKAQDKDVALLIKGDIFSATTHFDVYQEAVEEGVDVEVVHNASVLNAVSITGLQLYKFGRTASIPFQNENVKTPVRILKNNQSVGMHTLFLLDLAEEEGEKDMTVQQAIEYLKEKAKDDVFSEDTLCIGCARLGSKERVIKAGKASEVEKKDFGPAPHCLIVPGKMHFKEEEALQMYK